MQKAHKHLKDFFIDEGDDDPHPAVLFAGVGHRHRAARAGRSGVADRIRRGPARDAVAAGQGMPRRLRLAEELPRASSRRGWFFEFENPHYPDVDDTAMVVHGAEAAGRRSGRSGHSPRRSIGCWRCRTTTADGRRSTRPKDRPILEKIPFADHNAMQDPSCPDITGRVLECLGHNGFTPHDPIVQRAIEFIQSQQDTDGAWWGRWGVNYVYGTWQVLTGLQAVGEDMNAPYIQRAAAWLQSVQKPDGSFGETCPQLRRPLHSKAKAKAPPRKPPGARWA